MPQIEHKAVYGLELQSNSFKVREGSLERAENIVVSQDDIYTKRRGQKEFVDPSTTEIVKQTSYQDKFIGISDGLTTNKIQIYNQDTAGNYSSTTNLVNETGLTWTATSQKPQVVESNGNLYVSVDTGVIKLESTLGTVLRAGIDEATDLTIFRSVFSKQETYFTPDSQIGYRIVFGRKDANQNKIIGAPSEFAISTNTVTSASYSNPSADLRTIRVTSASFPFAGTAAQNFVYISGAGPNANIPDGVYPLTSISAGSYFEFLTPIDVSPTSGTLNWGAFYNVKLEFDLPDQIQTTDYFCQIYRANASATSAIEPDEATLQLVDEFNVATADITKGFVTYYDITPDILRGAFLYTNPNTGEPRGIAEANVRPPQCKDLEVFKNHVFYAAPTSPYRLALNVVTSTTVTMPDDCAFTIQTTAGANVRTYRGYAAADVGNRIVQASSSVGSLNLMTVNYTAHGFISGDTISLIEAVDSSEAQISVATPGSYVITRINDNQFTFPVSGTPASPASLSFAGLVNSSSERIFYVSQSNAASNIALVAAAIDSTARHIVRAINRDTAGNVIAFYTSSPLDVPGKMSLQTKTTSTNIKINAVTPAIVDSFLPSIPTTGSTVLGTRDSESGAVYIAKQGQPESVPLANKIVVGSKTAETLRIKALKDSLIIIKKDGVYRINGSDINSFSATILDSTITCKASDSIAVLNNKVWMLCEQGFVAVSETSVEIKSRQIEPLLTAIVGKLNNAGESLSEDTTHAVGYESDRLYICTAVSPTAEVIDNVDPTPDRVYVFNDLTNAWTTWDTIFTDCFNNPKDDRLYFLTMDNIILREKKSQNRLDYSDAEFTVTILSTPSTTTATMSIVGGSAAVGDVVVIDDTEILNRIVSVDGSVYTFARPFSFVATDTGILYKSITSVIRTSPLTGGDTSRWKQFSEYKTSFRNNAACSRMSTYFLTDDVPGSEATEWESVSAASTGGWGDLPWGGFPWGLEEGTNAVFETNASQPMRLYIPLEAQRGTFIQAHMEHSSAAENIAMQSIAYTARIYGQRTTK